MVLCSTREKVYVTRLPVSYIFDREQRSKVLKEALLLFLLLFLAWWKHEQKMLQT